MPRRLDRRHAAAAPGLSVRAWYMMTEITGVDRWMTPERQRRVVEMHPEVTFRTLDGGGLRTEIVV